MFDALLTIVTGLGALALVVVGVIAALVYLAHLHGQSKDHWDGFLKDIGWHDADKKSKRGNRDRE